MIPCNGSTRRCLDYYLLSCANLSDEQTVLCSATCMNHTYDDMKKQIEQVSTSNKSSTSTYTTKIKLKAETQYLAHYDESAHITIKRSGWRSRER